MCERTRAHLTPLLSAMQVNFDIDANGIVHVSAKDKATSECAQPVWLELYMVLLLFCYVHQNHRCVCEGQG